MEKEKEDILDCLVCWTTGLIICTIILTQSLMLVQPLLVMVSATGFIVCYAKFTDYYKRIKFKRKKYGKN